LARAFGITGIIVALLAVALPIAVAYAMFSGVTVSALSTPAVGLVGSAVALIGVIICVFGAIVGKGAQSAAVIFGALMNTGVLVGFGLAVFLPLLIAS
jgi:hypothetical protein